MSNIFEMLGGESKPPAFTTESQPGQKTTGTIQKVTLTQSKDFTTGEPEYWQDGKPKNIINITIQTQQKTNQEDDGQRVFYLKTWGDQARQMRKALKEAEAKDLNENDNIEIEYLGITAPTRKGMQGTKAYQFTIHTKSNKQSNEQKPIEEEFFEFKK